MHKHAYVQLVFRDFAFKLKPLKLSSTLIDQLLALEKSFSSKATISQPFASAILLQYRLEFSPVLEAHDLQKLVSAKRNKNKYFKAITEEARSFSKAIEIHQFICRRSPRSRSRLRSASSWQRP